ncbi:MAG TPA: hypothetical protein VGQ57_18960 [Polyangiaceae bacterium]|jgi:hypothetical protein|nr:hypothetical protein [Polyangiaceae bacterium]
MATLVEAIQTYCLLHPRAADTIEGVRAWLPPELRQSSKIELEAALATLVASGSVTRRSISDGSVIYFSAALPREP